MYDYLISATESFLRYGLSPTALIISIFALFKTKKAKRLISKRIPWLFKDESDVLNYQARQIRIEAKLDAVARHLGVEVCDLQSNISSTASVPDLKKRFLSLRTAIRRGNQYRRVKKMKNYLRKLGSRKFQTYLVFTICNILTAYFTWTGEVDVNAKLAGFMPLINGGAQLIAGVLYNWVEGRVDKARASGEYQSNPGETYH